LILVTGGAGYIGSHFLKTYLTARPGEKVVVIDDLSVGHKQALDFTDDIIFYQVDVGNKHAVKEILRKHAIQAVIHFAGYCYVNESQILNGKYFHNNVNNGLTLFSAMQECGVAAIVFSSSCATYGNPQYVPLDEEHPQNPASVYGFTKLMLETALKFNTVDLGWNCVTLRYANAAGADESGAIGESHDPEPHLIPRALKAALGQIDFVEILGDDYDTEDGTCVRDYIHVQDLARVHLAALDLAVNKKWSGAINLGTTRGASVKEILRLCEEITGRKIPVKVSARRPGDPSVFVSNSKKAEALLGWKPEYDLAQTIASAWRWEMNRRY
jgi:UDP-glucose-4-epimerase GalE